MATSTSEHRDIECDEPVTVEERITAVIEDMGGFPNDNEFTQTVQDMRANGHSWEDIRDEIQPLFNIASKAAFEATFDAYRQWEVVTVANRYNATARTEFKAHTVKAETAAEAEEQVRSQLPEGTAMTVDTSRTKFDSVKKTKRDN